MELQTTSPERLLPRIPSARRARERRAAAVPRSLSVREGDRLALALRLAMDRVALPLARAARAFVERRGWARYGFARLDDFGRESFQRSGRLLRELASLDRSLTRLPVLRHALTGADGGVPLGRTVAAWIGRVAAPESIGTWIALARTATAREMRAAVRAAHAARSPWPPGAGPEDAVHRADSDRPHRPPALRVGTAHEDPAAMSGAVSRGAWVREGADSGDHGDLAATAAAFNVLLRDPVSVALDAAASDASAGVALDAVARDLSRDAVTRGASAEADGDDLAVERGTLRIPVPPSVQAAFTETLDLHRAVCGANVTVESFVEALAAEAAAGGTEVDDRFAPWLPHRARARHETELARQTGGWADLPRGVTDEREVRALCPELDELARVSASAGLGTLDEIQGQIGDLFALEEKLRLRLGETLAALADAGAWQALRFMDLGHYAEQRLGMSRSAAEKWARLARALRRLPKLRKAHESGWVGFEAAQLVVQAVGQERLPEEAEQAWVAEAMYTTVKRLRDSIPICSRLPRLSGEGVPPPPPPGIHDALPGRSCLPNPSGDGGHPPPAGSHDAPPGRSCLPRPSGEGGRPPLPPTDEEWHASLRRDPGRTLARVRELGRQVLERRHADLMLRLRVTEEIAAQFLGAVEGRRAELQAMVTAPPPAAIGGGFPGADDGATGAAAGAAAGPAGPWPPTRGDAATVRESAGLADSGALPSLQVAQLFANERLRLPTWVGLLSLLEEYAQTWDDPRGIRRREADATYADAGYRCMAPGCTSRRNLEEHHVVYRSRGGDDAAANRICLCRFHHQEGEHGGMAAVTGQAPLGLEWRLGSAAVGRWFRNERRLDARRT